MSDDRPQPTYYKHRASLPASKALVFAVENVENHNEALDIGAGSLIDAQFLLENGFSHVTAIDNNPNMETYAARINDKRLTTHVTKMEDFEFPENTYDLISAMYSIYYIPEDVFGEVMRRIKKSLRKGGVFVAHFLGPNDEWNTHRKPGVHYDPMVFLSEHEIRLLLEDDMDIISFKESEHNAETMVKDMKHWHTFYVRARKK